MNHSNTDTGKRVELHCHTKLGSTGAVNSATEIIKAAKGGNMSAVSHPRVPENELAKYRKGLR